jgi:hypothetical protein
MGTTSLNSAYENIFTIVDKEMERLASSNFLTTSTFKMINLGDQRTLPLDFHFTKALSYFNACSQCRPSLEAAWGKQQDDALETLDLKLSLIQGLSKYYGSGFFDLDFFDMRSLDTSDPIRYMASVGASTKIGGEDPLNQKDVLKFLDQRSATRKGSTRIFKIGSELPILRLEPSSLRCDFASIVRARTARLLSIHYSYLVVAVCNHCSLLLFRVHTRASL